VTRAFVGLGANLGERERTIRAAATLLGAERMSSLRETAPWGVVEQPLFINAAAELETELPAVQLLERLLEVEQQLGRRRGTRRWGPRTIDLDLLLYGEEQIDIPGLTVPHPHLHEREFVLVPLVELDPQLGVPGRGTVSTLLAELQSAP
jgi:2-amino-4-hydroxy-6-hydroxymethyldihydropteridine diphosphokinase